MGIFDVIFGRRPINAGLNKPDQIYLKSADVHVARGEQALQKRDLEKAILEFKYAIIADNSNAKALSYLRGSVLGPLNVKRTTKGQALVESAMQAQQQGAHGKAVKLLTQAIDLCPVAAVASYCFRGKSYLALGQYKEAIADLTIAIGYGPMNVEAYADRAKAHEALGDTESARRDQEKAKVLLMRS